MKTFKYNYCAIYKDNIYLSDNLISIHTNTFLENVEINIDDNGVMDICGEEVQFGFNFNKEKLSNLTETPQDNQIKHHNGLKLFGFYLIKPYDYVETGWYKLKERKNKRIILNKYKLEFI